MYNWIFIPLFDLFPIKIYFVQLLDTSLTFSNWFNCSSYFDDFNSTLSTKVFELQVSLTLT